MTVRMTWPHDSGGAGDGAGANVFDYPFDCVRVVTYHGDAVTDWPGHTGETMNFPEGDPGG